MACFDFVQNTAITIEWLALVVFGSLSQPKARLGNNESDNILFNLSKFNIKEIESSKKLSE
jgi:hypothetical protein